MKQKIDFPNLADEIFDEKIEWIVPQEVLNELGTLKDRKGMKVKERNAAKISFEILEKIDAKIVELGGKNPNVDIKIVNYIIGKDIILATMDKDLKSRVKNKILTIRGKKMLEII
jgi:rRNA-processing protein FCF1